MNTNSPPQHGNSCPVCGTPLPSNVLPEQCPKCLLGAGMATERRGVASASTVILPTMAAGSTGLPKAGDQFGHYHVSRLLGQGGMGAVYEAEDLETGRQIALKVLSQ